MSDSKKKIILSRLLFIYIIHTSCKPFLLYWIQSSLKPPDLCPFAKLLYNWQHLAYYPCSIKIQYIIILLVSGSFILIFYSHHICFSSFILLILSFWFSFLSSLHLHFFSIFYIFFLDCGVTILFLISLFNNDLSPTNLYHSSSFLTTIPIYFCLAFSSPPPS